MLPCKGDQSKPMSYLEPGRRLLLPSEWGDSASINPMTPIDSCMWQPRRSRTPPTAWSAVAAGVRDRHLAARSVASLARLASCCGDDGNFDPSLTVPDGVVPSALPLFLYSIGVPEDVMVETVGRILRAQCESYAYADLTRARQMAGLPCMLSDLDSSARGSLPIFETWMQEPIPESRSALASQSVDKSPFS